MVKVSLACAVGGASLQPQQNPNNEAELDSVYSSAQHSTAQHCHYTVRGTFQYRTHSCHLFANNTPSDDILQTKYFFPFIVSNVNADFSPFSSFYLQLRKRIISNSLSKNTYLKFTHKSTCG
jgi:hypothetical protein